jgi:hypothetical protein
MRKPQVQLTSQYILDLPPGRELDGIFGEKVMGWVRGRTERGEGDWYPPEHADRRWGYAMLPEFSTNENLILDIMVRLGELGFSPIIQYDPRDLSWLIGIPKADDEHLPTIKRYPSIMANLCKAALLAVGV